MRSEYESAVAAGLQIAESREPLGGGTPFVVVASDQKVESLERLQESPARIRANPTFTAVESFVQYVNDFKDRETRIFASKEGGRLAAVLDYHDAQEGPRWCEHQAVLALRHTKEWQAWSGRDGQWLDQPTFAEFLEDRIPEIVEPAGAVILGIAKHLEAKRSVQFKSAVNLDNGTTQFLYDEEVESRGKGRIDVPREFTLGLRVYEHTEPFRLTAKLRYRIQQDRLSFSFRLERVDDVLDAAFRGVLATVEVGTQIRPLHGTLSGR